MTIFQFTPSRENSSFSIGYHSYRTSLLCSFLAALPDPSTPSVSIFPPLVPQPRSSFLEAGRFFPPVSSAPLFFFPPFSLPRPVSPAPSSTPAAQAARSALFLCLFSLSFSSSPVSCSPSIYSSLSIFVPVAFSLHPSNERTNEPLLPFYPRPCDLFFPGHPPMPGVGVLLLSGRSLDYRPDHLHRRTE